MLRIYHNARCSKSRSACAIVAERGIEADIVNYLDTPPGKEELRALLAKLGITPRELVRSGEAVFKEHYAGRELSDEQWLDALAAHPILIERPIVVRGDKAVVARPPEKVLELL
jgi:arsenate reductase